MASNPHQHNQLLTLFAAYAQRLDKLYDDFVTRLIASLPLSEDEVWQKLADNPLFLFDDLPYLKARLQHIFDDYVNKQVLCYKAGITDGVALAFSQDKINLGKYTILQDEAIKAARNAAVASFIANRMSRAEGLSLSDKVWNYSQLGKSEVEMGISNVIKDGLKAGTSAEELGRKVRQYLNNPDMMYRRYWVTVATAGGGKKKVARWYRRHIDPQTGKVTFKDEPLERVGTGVYRSARMNGYRLMRTEINMSYHKANASRWAKEPFVYGIRVWKSPEHPKEDICDELEGYYPKDFVFSGWHVQCLCASAPLTLWGDEKRDFYRRLMKGEDMSNFHSKHEITEANMNPNWKHYIETQHAAILKAGERGKLAYHLRDNQQYWINQFSAAERKQMGLLKDNKERIKAIADARHAARTDAQAKDIADRWHEHKRVDALVREANKIIPDLKEYPLVANWKVLQQAVDDRNAHTLEKLLGDKMILKKLAYEKVISPEQLKWSELTKVFSEKQISSIQDMLRLVSQQAIREKTQTQAINYLRMGTSPISDVLADEKKEIFKKLVEREKRRIEDTFRFNHAKERIDIGLDYIKKNISVIGGAAKVPTVDISSLYLGDAIHMQLIAGEIGEKVSKLEAVINNASFVATTKSPIVRQLYEGIKYSLQKYGLNADVSEEIIKLEQNIERLKREAAKKASGKATSQAVEKAKSTKATVADIEAAIDATIKDVRAVSDKKQYYDYLVAAIEDILTYRKGDLSKALLKRKDLLLSAVKEDVSDNIIALQLRNFKHGVAVQEAWDKQVWGSFSEAQIKNMKEIEKKLGIRKGRPMSVASADRQNSNINIVEEWLVDKNGGYSWTIDGKKISCKLNPKYSEPRDKWYHINCATCSPTYVLREWGFDITAKAKNATLLNKEIARNKSFDVWKNADGTKAQPTNLRKWADSKGYKNMSPKRYREFYEESTQEEGTYIVTVAWSRHSGHATILKRLANGKLYYIEPQHYYGSEIGDLRPIDSLCKAFTTIMDRKGIMRVDDKLFDESWCSIFDKRR